MLRSVGAAIARALGSLRGHGPAPQAGKIVVVEYQGFHVCYVEGDHPLAAHLENPQARVVATAGRLAPPQDLDFRTYGDAPGADPMLLIMAHLWRHDLDFVYLDIGANVGVTLGFAATFMLRCGRRNEIWCFEPGDAFRSLTETIAANGIGTWCHALNAACSDRPGHLVLHQIEANSSAGSLLPEIAARAGASPMSHRRVEVTTVDAFVRAQGIATNLVCKIDTEGNDLKVIGGARECIAGRLVPMMLEFTPGLIRAYADPVRALCDLAGDFVFVDERRRDGPIMDFGAYVASIDGYTDLIALPHALPGKDDLVERLRRG